MQKILSLRATARACKAVVPAVALAAAWGIAHAAPSGTYNAVASLTTSEGSELWQPLTQGADGLMYGVGPEGGTTGNGTLFRIEADASITLLHNFARTDGEVPGKLTLGTDGWLYGVTSLGGANGLGEIYKVSTAGDFVVTYSFSNGANDGLSAPSTGLVPDGQGGFYAAGAYASQPGAGVLFHYTPATAQVDALAAFQGTKLGRSPNSLVMSPDGTLYGTTQRTHDKGNNSGTVFSYKPGGTLKTVYEFDYNVDGSGPANEIVIGQDKAIYGILRFGGGGDGNVFRVTPRGVHTVLHAFSLSDPLGASPWGGLSIDASGMLYGTTTQGGKLKGGTVFAMSTKGKGTVLQSLDSTNTALGDDSNAAPTWVGGHLWGLTSKGGANGVGVVYRDDLAQ